ncbi:MAG TPA: SDR family NAD(P)-dependent oxidoreductase [Opitutaceae bacterium]|nr:SDR family NAD(P)-dependent oxidoreductase [Opitutaceae bacterium]
MAIDLTGKVCVITGAGEGVGRGLVLGFQRRGAQAIGGVRSLEKSAAALAPAWAVKFDVTRPDEIRAAVDAILARHGRIDVWINNAGIYPRHPADRMTTEEWRRVIDTNLDGAWRCCEAIIPQLKRQQSGVILNVGSITLRLGLPQMAHYEASKGGLVGLTRGLARDLGAYHIRVNCVHLGAVQTEGELRLFPDQAAMLRTLEEKQSLPGRLTPESVEPVFAFLASDESRDITGQCLTADRGWTHD